jgi:hypothetical protein
VLKISLEVSDNRLFCGCWSYLTIAYWLSDSSGVALDLVIDPYTRAERGEVILTGTTFVDAVPRWP